MSKQERRAKAEAKAAVQAAEIIEKATAKVAATRTRTLSEEHLALAPKIKEYREQGVAWWIIGFKLSLPGSADNVKDGKSGASFARRIYASAYGEVPRTQSRGSRRTADRNEDVAAVKRQRKTDRVEAVRSGQSVLRDSMTDEEVVETLRGRVIGWSVDLSSLSEKMQGTTQHMDQETGVHRKWAKIETHGGDRCLVFKEFDPNAPVKYRSFAGATRIVRVREIHTVR